MSSPARRAWTWRFWVLYAVAWLPYMEVYASAFVLSGEADLSRAFLASALNAFPPALLGLLVIRICRRFTWTSDRRVRFFALHALFAFGYAFFAAAATLLLFSLLRSLFESGEMSGASAVALMAWQMFMGLMLYTTLASVTYAFGAVARLREEQHRLARAEALRTRAELQALRAQLNPHFLFNTLHSVLALVRRDSDAAEDAIEQFAALMRYASGIKADGRDVVALAEEWEFVRNYLSLERIRLGNRLSVRADVPDDVLDARVPAFSLQPLVENAIRHAIAPRSEGGVLWIAASANDDMLELEVRDDGPGATLDDLPAPGHLGLRLVRQRLEAIYGAQATMDVVSAPGRGFRVRLAFPAEAPVALTTAAEPA